MGINDTDWHEIVLDLIEEKLNLMTTEYFQLYKIKNGCIKDKKIRDQILCYISSGEINSCHITREEAEKYLVFLKKIKKK